ncbi:MAG: dockerin type I repeat-containing protein [Phycisphaerales bacterium]
MNRNSAAIAAAAATLLAAAASAPAFNIPWFCVHTGGTTQSGSWIASATFGQPISTFATGGSFAIDGGYMGGTRLAPPPICLGDTNGDNQVNTADLVFFLGRFGQAVPPGSAVDFNNDGVVNTADLVTFLGRFGASCP